MNILFLGDVVGRTGREAVVAALPDLRRRLALDLVVVNAENASHGFGLAPEMADALFAAGADCLTLGNHAWDRKEIIPYIAREPRLVRPANYPPGTPGQGSFVVVLADGRKALILNVMARLFMDALDCPFRTAAVELSRHRLGGTVQAALVDIHGEASSEKAAFAWSFDGQVSAVIGTHTHVPSADHRILPGGTAFATDAGMCGDYASVIGMAREASSRRFWTKLPGERLHPADGPATLSGVFVRTDDATGRAEHIAPLRQGPHLIPAWPGPG
jgi:hypothetical protein